MKAFRLFLILVILVSCKKTDANKDGHLLSRYTVSEKIAETRHPEENTIAALKDIVKCDSLIRLEKDKGKLFMLYQQKINLLVGIGKVKDAYYEQGIAMELLPESDARRFEYEAIDAYLHHDQNRYSQLLHKAIDEYKKDPNHAGQTLNQATCYALLGDDESSKTIMKNFLKCKDDQTILFAYENYSFFKKQIIEGRTKLMELLKSEDR